MVTVGIIETCTFNVKEEGKRVCICAVMYGIVKAFIMSDRGGHEWVCFVTVCIIEACIQIGEVLSLASDR